jgi:methylated-DNA-[protein]-cysteine S-methyltransferase
MQYRTIESPIGPLLVAGDDEGLKYIGFPTGKGRIEPGDDWTLDDGGFEETRMQLEEYFNGKRREFDLNLAPDGTAFQRDVLNALQGIPYGETRSYQEIAVGVGRPKAVRAVGAANGRNPLPIVIPCHRVIGANGSLTGFGGGIPIKKYLLDLEQGKAPKLEATE